MPLESTILTLLAHNNALHHDARGDGCGTLHGLRYGGSLILEHSHLVSGVTDFICDAALFGDSRIIILRAEHLRPHRPALVTNQYDINNDSDGVAHDSARVDRLSSWPRPASPLLA